jgi:hypothetical protein
MHMLRSGFCLRQSGNFSFRAFAYSSKFFLFLVLFALRAKSTKNKEKSTTLPQANSQVSESPIYTIAVGLWRRMPQSSPQAKIADASG